MNYKRLLLSAVGVLTLVFSVANVFIPSGIAAAATPAPIDPNAVKNAQITWVDRATIDVVVAGQTFVFKNSDVATGTTYKIQGYGCYGQIGVPDMNNPGTVTFDMDVIPTGVATSTCQNVNGANGDKFTAGNSSAASILYTYVDATHITRVDNNKDWTFTKSPQVSTIFLRDKENGASCQDRLIVTGDLASATLYVLDSSSPTGRTQPISSALATSIGLPSSPSCYSYTNNQGGGGMDSGTQFSMGNVAAANGTATGSGSSTSGGTPAGGGATNDTTLDCGGGALNWIVCPVITLAQGAAEQVDSFITNTLNVDVKNIFYGADSTGAAQLGYYTAWNSFRVLATAILVIGGLVMVASQALGFEILDAYTIRKVLPRLLVAIIGISLSWPLMRFAVNFFDTLGFDIRNLIYHPFAGLNPKLSIGVGIASYFAAAAAVVALGFASLTLILSALLGILVGFFILVIRQIAIVIIIILSPIAIACYILPNTQRVWKLWVDNFLGLMLMFPIISAFIATGHVFAAVALTPGGGNTGSNVAQVIGIVAYFLPYFLLPIAFRLASGSIGAIAGFVNDKHRGLGDRLKNTRAKAMADRNQRWRNGSLYSDKRGPASWINAAGKRTNAGARGRFGFGEQGRTAMSLAGNASVAQTLKENPRLMQLALENDDSNAVLALSGGSRRGAEQAAAQLFEGDVARQKTALAGASAVGFNQQNARAALTSMAQNKSRAVGAGRVDIINDGIQRLSGGNERDAQNLAQNFQYLSRGGGRVDLGGEWTGEASHQEAVQFAAQAYGNADERTVLPGAGGNGRANVARAQQDLAVLSGLGRTDIGALMKGHTAPVEQAGATLKRVMEHGNAEQKKLAATRLLEMQANLSGATGDNANIVNRILTSDAGTGTTVTNPVTGAKQRASDGGIGVNYADTELSVAAQLARKAGTDVTTLTRGARTFSDEVPPGARVPGEEAKKAAEE